MLPGLGKKSEERRGSFLDVDCRFRDLHGCLMNLSDILTLVDREEDAFGAFLQAEFVALTMCDASVAASICLMYIET